MKKSVLRQQFIAVRLSCRPSARGRALKTLLYAGAVTQNENPAYIIASSRSFHRLVGQFFRYLTAMLPADCYLTWKLRIKASIMRFHDSKARLHAVYNDGQPDIAAQMWQQHAVEPQIVLAGRSKVPWVNINSVQSNHC